MTAEVITIEECQAKEQIAYANGLEKGRDKGQIKKAKISGFILGIVASAFVYGGIHLLY